jgi:phospholipid/cholesterol/gamma-HCH transport system ATP-binding protein
MIGVLRADDGEVLFKGEDVGYMDADQLRDLRRRVSYVFQGGALFDSMDVLTNVGYGLIEHTELGDDEIEHRVVDCLNSVGLGPDSHPGILQLMPSNLSGGMKKRVALARSIALEPEVILYDEPTTGLDPANCRRIAHMIRNLQEELGVTSVVVTHDMDTMRIVSDRVALLHDQGFPFVAPLREFVQMENEIVRGFVRGAFH